MREDEERGGSHLNGILAQARALGAARRQIDDLKQQLTAARRAGAEEMRERVRAEVLAAVGPLFEEEGCGCDNEEPVLSGRHECFAGRVEWALRLALTPTPTTEARDA